MRAKDQRTTWRKTVAGHFDLRFSIERIGPKAREISALKTENESGVLKLQVSPFYNMDTEDSYGHS